MDDLDARNRKTSEKEVQSFLTVIPEKYFLYIDEKTKLATTWMGDKLGEVTFGREYKSPAFGGFPSKRVPVRIKAINGQEYYGTYFKSSGNYARIKLCKGK